MSSQSGYADAFTDAPLHFDSAHPGEAPATVCTSCSEPIRSVYHTANANIVCSRCRGKLEAMLASSGGMRRFRRALGFGAVAAIAGAVFYYGFREITGIDFGLISVLVGFVIGKAVFVGAERRGGRRYQILAVVLTYFAIASTYVPTAIKELRAGLPAVSDSSKAAARAAAKGDSVSTSASAATSNSSVVSDESTVAASPAATRKTAAKPVGFLAILFGLAAVLLLVAALPIMVGMGSIISVVILVIGLLQAWRMNKAVVVSVSGPYRLAGPATDAEPATA